MSSSFRIKDGLAQLGVRKPFGVNQDGVHAFECLRILCGTVDLEDKNGGMVLKTRYCFLTEQRRKLKTNTIREIIDRAFDGDISEADAEVYLIRSAGRNEKFWGRVKGELCLAVACCSRSQFTQSFLHIYRLLEMISVALPLFYASVEHDYYKALSFLKELPQNPRDGDLAIFRKFVEIVAKEGGFEHHNIEINYLRADIKWTARYYEQLSKYVLGGPGRNTTIDQQISTIRVPFSEFPSFFVTFRNRLFHNMLSADNLDLDELGGAELTCEPLIKPALNWLTLTLCVILKQNASRFI